MRGLGIIIAALLLGLVVVAVWGSKSGHANPTSGHVGYYVPPPVTEIVTFTVAGIPTPTATPLP